MTKVIYLDESIFEQDVKGFLFFMEVLMDGSDRAKLIFDYSKEALYKLREGDIVAVESFTNLTSDGGGKHYTLLTITRVEPTHVTIDRLKRYRFMGAVREFLTQTTKDFEEEDPRVIRDHVYIGAEAVSTGYLMSVVNGVCIFKNEDSKPILGRDAGLLKASIMGQLINRGIENGLIVGNLHSEYEEKKKIEVMIKPNKLVTHHFTVFGYTGSGKSNLTSGIVSKMIENSSISSVIFDLSDEYTALLPDILQQDGFLIVDQRDLPESLLNYLRTNQGDLNEISREFAVRTKKPGVLDNTVFESVYQMVFTELLKQGRIKALDAYTLQDEQDKLDFRAFMQKLKERCGVNATNQQEFNQLEPSIIVAVRDDSKIQKDLFGNFELSPDNLDLLEDVFNQYYTKLNYPLTGNYMKGITKTTQGLFTEIRARMKLAEKKEQPNNNFVDGEWIISTFVGNQRKNQKLGIVVSSEKDNLVRLISYVLARSLQTRRVQGTKKHDVLFVVDEGHEFVPNPREGGISQDERDCSKIIESLTRMGRKYGLGICISSQRAAHLNTTALSNCHTTFLGALPRKYDRESMQEAYAVSSEVLKRVVTFPSGNWYVVSNGAMGINNVPIWINSPNREKMIAEFFKDSQYLNIEAEKTLKQNGLL